MNLEEAIGLLEAVSDFNFKASKKIPNIGIYDRQKDGYVLCLKTNLVTEKYRDHIKSIVKLHNLRIRKSERYLIIQGF